MNGIGVGTLGKQGLCLLQHPIAASAQSKVMVAETCLISMTRFVTTSLKAYIKYSQDKANQTAGELTSYKKSRRFSRDDIVI